MLAYRDLLLALNERLPSFPGLDKILDIECEIMGISVEQIKKFDVPIYKISLPMLLPNMRRRKLDYNNALTQTINEAVHRFYVENNIQPFHCAKVMFLSYCTNPKFAIDNDNKESAVVTNGLIGHFLSDESPLTCDTSYYCITKGVSANKTEIYITDERFDFELMLFIREIRIDNK